MSRQIFYQNGVETLDYNTELKNYEVITFKNQRRKKCDQ